MEKEHQEWLEIYLPFFVRFKSIVDTDKNHEYFKVAIKDLEEEYTKKTTTVLSVFRDTMKEHVEGRKHDKIWYMHHAFDMNLIPNRDDKDYQITKFCPKFLSHLDKINQILDELDVKKVEAFKPLPPPKTREDLKTEHGKKLYDLMDKWATQLAVTAPNEAMALFMMQHSLLEHEENFFDENEEFKESHKFWGKIGSLIDEDEEIKKKYFNDIPPDSSSDEDDSEEEDESSKDDKE
jgi:hypothetical protein